MKSWEPSEKDVDRKKQLLCGVCALLRDGLCGEEAGFYFEQEGGFQQLDLQTLAARPAPKEKTGWMRQFLRSGQPFLLLAAEGRRAYEAACACGGSALVLVTGLRQKPEEARCEAACALLAALPAPRGGAAVPPLQAPPPLPLQTLARELRAPLSVALQAADVLKTQAPPRAEPACREAFSFLEQSLYQELRLTENLAWLEAAEKGGEREYLDLRELTHQAVLAAGRYARANGVRLVWRDEAGGPVLGAGRADFWQRIVLNLLSNAVRQCPETGGEVTVCLAQRETVVLLTVQDNGPGIAPGDAPHLFEAFWHGGSAAGRAKSGVGLGLYLVRSFAAALGGEVWAENAPQGGARFGVRLPLAPPEGPRDEQLHASVLPYGDGAAGELAKTELSVLDQWPAGES